MLIHQDNIWAIAGSIFACFVDIRFWFSNSESVLLSSLPVMLRSKTKTIEADALAKKTLFRISIENMGKRPRETTCFRALIHLSTFPKVHLEITCSRWDALFLLWVQQTAVRNKPRWIVRMKGHHKLWKKGQVRSSCLDKAAAATTTTTALPRHAVLS